MSDYIKREDAIKAVANNYWHGTECECYAFAHKALDGIQSADVVPVVRCKDCKYWDKDTLRHNSNDVAEWDECECEMLARRDRWNEIDRYCCDIHFCADGERKDDE